MKTRTKVLIGLFGFFTLFVLLLGIFGSDGKNEEFQPQEEFRLTPWIEIDLFGVDMSINRAVFYLFLAAGLTCFTMVWIARRMVDKPNKTQMAVELAYDLTKNNITQGNLPDQKLATRWFGFIATLFFFIWFSNMIGYIPLPTNTHETIDIFGVEVPAFAIYAATANISMGARAASLLRASTWSASPSSGPGCRARGGPHRRRPLRGRLHRLLRHALHRQAARGGHADEDRAQGPPRVLFGFFALVVAAARDLRLRRQERGVPAAGGVPADAVDRDRHRRHRHVDQPRGLLPLPRRGAHLRRR